MIDYPIESTIHVIDCPCNQPSCSRTPIGRYVYVWPERPMTVNVAIRKHYRVVSAFTAEWRAAFRLMSMGSPPLQWANITVQTIHGTNRKMDAGAEALAVKAAIDGIVDGGVLPDDNPLFVRSVRFVAPVFIKGEERVIITLDGLVATPAG